MKLLVQILTFIVVSTTIYAQNPRIMAGNPRTETYSYLKGGDSLRFTILGKNDTLQETKYYRNGQLQRKKWKRDSVYDYDALGRLMTIFYDVNKFGESENNLRRFSTKGELYHIESFKNNVYVEQNFDKAGQLILKKRIIHAENYTYERLEDRNGVPIKARKTDTLTNGDKPTTIVYDTVFFDNGRPNRVYKKKNSEYDYSDCRYFDSTGVLIKSIANDSFRLIEFKDNVACYYGLKNRRGDTVVKPRFDRIEFKNSDFILAYTGENAILLQPDGSPMSTNFKALSKIQSISETMPYEKSNSYSKSRDIVERNREIYWQNTDYIFVDGGKYGLMNQKAEVFMPPQYFFLYGRYIGDKKYFQFIERDVDSMLSTGFINRQGVPLFPEKFKGVVYSYYEDYFFLCLKPYQRQADCGNSEGDWMRDRTLFSYKTIFKKGQLTELPENNMGFGKADGTIILEPIYHRVTHIDSCLLSVSLVKNVRDEYHYDKRDGIYNARTKKWLLDTIDFEIKDREFLGRPFFIIYHFPTKKYGIMDTKGRYILPLAYDEIEIPTYLKNILRLKKDNKYQIATLKGDKISIQKEHYEHLTAHVWQIDDLESDENLTYFIAKRNKKWGVIDVKGKIVKPFVYDYVGKSDNSNSSFLLVKNNQAESFDLTSFPNETNKYPYFNVQTQSSNEVQSFNLVDSTQTVFFLNNTGKVVIPPQYKRIYTANSYGLVFLEDAFKHRKFVFSETGKLADFPFNYSIDWAIPKSSVMLVHDTSSVSFGVVSTDGKQLVPCQNYGVAIGDRETSTFFVKRDTPLVKRTFDMFEGLRLVSVDSDSLTIEDQNWLAYDRNGQQLSDKPFRFPIQFRGGIGIGMKDADFSLYRTDGSKLTVGGVQNFNNIRIEHGQINDFYALYYNQGMTPQMILTKLNGDIFVESGRYDGVSRFYGKYALVSKAGKIGMIDSLGKEIIAPEDLMTSKQPFMDSLDVVNGYINEKRRLKKHYNNNDFVMLPIKSYDLKAENNPDSLNLTPQQRLTLWNIMLQKTQHLALKTASDIKILRASILQTANFIFRSHYSTGENYTSPKRIVVLDSTIAFVLHENIRYHSNKDIFYNFYRRNNRWEDLKINDLLMIQGDKRWQMNDLITKKVKALKDQEIDCSNASAFITTVENQYMVTKEGIDFCFDSTKNGEKFVIVSFTWAELLPFLKMKIY